VITSSVLPQFQQARGYVNSELPRRLLRNLCRLDDAGECTLELAMRHS
jgi:hypothetical protein